MTVFHSQLTGADLHEPKGITSATSGQVYVADGAGSGDWTNQQIGSTYGTTTVFKSTGTTRSATTTLSADPVLKFALAVNSKYLVDVYLIVSSGSSSDFLYSLYGPAGYTLAGGAICQTTTVLSCMVAPNDNTPASGYFHTTGTSDDFITMRLYVTSSSTAGDWGLKWAQGVALGITSVRAGSFIDYRKVA